MERPMTRSFVATLGFLVLTAAMGLPAEAQSKRKTESEVVSIPSPGAFESLSAGNKRIATALFEAQTTAGSATPMTPEQIAQERRSGRKWGDAFPENKTQGLIHAATTRQRLGRHELAPHPP